MSLEKIVEINEALQRISETILSAGLEWTKTSASYETDQVFHYLINRGDLVTHEVYEAEMVLPSDTEPCYVEIARCIPPYQPIRDNQPKYVLGIRTNEGIVYISSNDVFEEILLGDSQLDVQDSLLSRIPDILMGTFEKVNEQYRLQEARKRAKSHVDSVSYRINQIQAAIATQEHE